MHVFELACFHPHNCKGCDLVVLHASYNLTLHNRCLEQCKAFHTSLLCDGACDLLCGTYYLELVIQRNLALFHLTVEPLSPWGKKCL